MARTPRARGTARTAAAPDPFIHKLVLNAWMIGQFGVDPLAEHANGGGKPLPAIRKLSNPIRDEDKEGLHEDGRHRFFHELSANGSSTAPVTAARLASYEDNILAHTQALNDRRQSSVNILIGAKKFIEGWDCWRVSTLGLMHVGKSEGSQIIQLFGRGVRLKGFGWSLKRSSRCTRIDKPRPANIHWLETLQVFGIEAEFMQRFQAFLKDEFRAHNILLICDDGDWPRHLIETILQHSPATVSNTRSGGDSSFEFQS